MTALFSVNYFPDLRKIVKKYNYSHNLRAALLDKEILTMIKKFQLMRLSSMGQLTDQSQIIRQGLPLTEMKFASRYTSPPDSSSAFRRLLPRVCTVTHFSRLGFNAQIITYKCSDEPDTFNLSKRHHYFTNIVYSQYFFKG